MDRIHWRDDTSDALSMATLPAEAGALHDLGFGRAEDLVPQAFAAFTHSYKTGSGYSFRMESVVRSPRDDGEFITAVKTLFEPRATYISWDGGAGDLPVLAFDAMRQKRFHGPGLVNAQLAFQYEHVELHLAFGAEAGSFQENVHLAAQRIGIDAEPLTAASIRDAMKAGPDELAVLAERRR